MGGRGGLPGCGTTTSVLQGGGGGAVAGAILPGGGGGAGVRLIWLPWRTGTEILIVQASHPYHHGLFCQSNLQGVLEKNTK